LSRARISFSCSRRGSLDHEVVIFVAQMLITGKDIAELTVDKFLLLAGLVGALLEIGKHKPGGVEDGLNAFNPLFVGRNDVLHEASQLRIANCRLRIKGPERSRRVECGIGHVM